MKVRKIMKTIQKNLLPTENDKKLDKWKSRLEKARLAYADALDMIKRNEALYDGTKLVETPVNGYSKKKLLTSEISVTNLLRHRMMQVFQCQRLQQ